MLSFLPKSPVHGILFTIRKRAAVCTTVLMGLLIYMSLDMHLECSQLCRNNVHANATYRHGDCRGPATSHLLHSEQSKEARV